MMKKAGTSGSCPKVDIVPNGNASITSFKDVEYDNEQVGILTVHTKIQNKRSKMTIPLIVIPMMLSFQQWSAWLTLRGSLWQRSTAYSNLRLSMRSSAGASTRAMSSTRHLLMRVAIFYMPIKYPWYPFAILKHPSTSEKMSDSRQQLSDILFLMIAFYSVPIRCPKTSRSTKTNGLSVFTVKQSRASNNTSWFTEMGNSSLKSSPHSLMQTKHFH